MSVHDDVAALLDALRSKQLIPDDDTIERLVTLVRADRGLVRTAMSTVYDLLRAHETTHAGETPCARCLVLEEIASELQLISIH